MSSYLENNMVGKKVLIASLIPDTGHLTPLFQIANKLMLNGISVLAIVPVEAKTLANIFNVPAKYIGTTVPIEGRKYISKVANSNFVLSTMVYGPIYTDKYIIPLTVNGIKEFPVLECLSKEYGPDLILADTHIFSPEYRLLASSVGCPVVMHYSKGNNYYVQNSSLWTRPKVKASVQHALKDIASSVHYKIKKVFFRKHFESRKNSDYIVKNFRNSISSKEKSKEIYITTGLAGLEQIYLGDLIRHLDPDIKIFGAQKPFISWLGSEKILDWLDRPKAPIVVYISFGTMISPPEKTIESIVKSLLRYKVRVLLATPEEPRFISRYTEESVLWKNWVPQTAVLDHKSVVAFVSHAGATSVQEAFWFGKPMMCIPGLWDQFYCSWFIEQVKAGVWMGNSVKRVRFIDKCVDSLLNDDVVHQNIKRLSQEVRRSEANNDLVQEIKSAMG